MTDLILCGRKFSRNWIVRHFRNCDGEQFSENGKRTLAFCGEWLSGAERFIVSTSGSTGEPKPISITREQMTLSARMTAAALGLKSGDRALVCLSPQYIAGLMMLVRGLELDLELTVIEPGSNPFDVLDLNRLPPFDFTALVPLQLQAILANSNHTAFLNKIKAVLVGGAPIAISLQQQIRKLPAAIYQTFGMTETVSHIALRRLNGSQVSESYHVLPGVGIGQDARGCLTIRSALTNYQTIVTNDLVELTSENRFRWLGRFDNVINTGGVKVPAEKVETAIEQALYEMGSEPTEFFVTGLPDERYHEVVVAVLTGKRLSDEVEQTLRARLTAGLEKYEVPKKILYTDSVVRTPSGKIDRGATLTEIQRVSGEQCQLQSESTLSR
ncbi:MAG TPA: AMP-binding protein [bacterium]